MTRRPRIALLAGAAIVAIALVVTLVVALTPRDDGPEAAAPDAVASWAPPAELPAAAEDAGWRLTEIIDPGWARETAEATGIPERVLLAYAGTALRKSEQDPSCAISWNTLAGIGAVESNHGRHAGSTIDEDGNATPPIFGIALTGETTNRIPDTDGGEFDGDAEWDRAVGPMQLLPETWRNWHGDAGGDGVSDPQNIDDAVFAASSYLCSRGPDMSTEEGWRAAITSYNDAGSYIGKVADAAVAYGEAVAGD